MDAKSGLRENAHFVILHSTRYDVERPATTVPPDQHDGCQQTKLTSFLDKATPPIDQIVNLEPKTHL